MITKDHFTLKATVWMYLGHAGWHFVTLPKKESAEIRITFDGLHGGWTSLRVIVNVGKTEWMTSIFYDAKQGAYLLPIKADVRKKGKISKGNTINFSIKIKI